MKKLLLTIIKVYKTALSPTLQTLFGRGCRFNPSCSEYSYKAIEKHGTKKGLILSIRRVGKCHPFSPGGLDPVPKKV